MTPKRLLALAALVVAFLVAGATPAFAHATLLTTEPQPGGRFETSPSAIELRFSEPVEVSLGGIRLFNGTADRVDVGAPEHPDGAANRVRASMPKLDDGTYVVTWRVISADSHPVQGAFTFQVGTKNAVTGANALAQRLLSHQGGSRTVGVVYAVGRVLLFGALALFIGGVVFMALVFPPGRESHVGRVLVWSGWIGCVAATLAGIALEGVYAAALPLTKVFDTSVWGDVLDTRFGRVNAARLVLLALAFPLLRLLFARPRTPPRRLSSWWFAAAATVTGAIAFTPGLAGHAGTGDYTGFAIPADAVHVYSMACWLGGLVLLLAVVLTRTDPDDLRTGIARFSALGLGAIAAVVVTGAFQAWRQVGSFSALRDTEYGQLLIVKLVAFAALVVAASFSREIVNRRFRTYPDDDFEDVPVVEPALAVPVGAGSSSKAATATATTTSEPAFPVETLGTLSGNGGREHDGGVDLRGGNGRGSDGRGGDGRGGDDWDDDEDDDETEVRRLRKSVVVEVIIALVVLSVTALLVNSAPARSVQTQPVSMTLKSSKVWVDIVIAPGVAGGNDIHVTALPVGDTVVNVTDMQVQLTRIGSNLPALEVPLRDLGPGHYISPLYDVPYPGDWRIIVRATLGQTDQAVLTGRFTLR